MKILFVNTYFSPNMFGGTEHSVKLLASFFSKKYSCAVFSVDSIAKGLERNVVDNVTVYRSGSVFFDFKSRYTKKEHFFCKMKNRLADLYNPVASAHFKKVLDEFEPDIVHTNGLRGIGPQIWEIANQRGVKIVHTLRDYHAADPLMRESTPSSPFIMFWRYLWNQKSSFIDVVTATSTFALNKMLKAGFSHNKSCITILNGIPFEKREFLENIEYSKNQKRKNTRFLFAGTLVDFKGVLNLLEAYVRLQKEISSVELVYCGEGPLLEQIRRCSNCYPGIYIRGKLDVNAMKREFLEADVCVVPSLWEEPFGRVVVEAAYNGCALIVSNRGGIPEIIQKLGAGIVCDCSNIDQLTTAMACLCDEKKRRLQLDCFRNSVEYFSISNNINSFDVLYTRLCKTNV